MTRRISDRIPTARGGSKPNGGSGKPVTLVRIVVTRNTAVQPPNGCPVTRPYIISRPAARPIRLSVTWICRNRSVGIPQVTIRTSIWPAYAHVAHERALGKGLCGSGRSYSSTKACRLMRKAHMDALARICNNPAPYRKYRRAGMQIEFMTIDVFTDRRFGGNPLAVVPDAAALDGALMQSIAAEFNLAETTFVLPPCDAAHTAEIRIFTPRAELPFAGHPNIGTAFALAALRGAAPQPLTRGEDVAGEIVAAACGLAADAVATGNHAPCIASCGIPFVLAEIESAAAL